MDSKKFIAMVHLIIHECKNADDLGSVKLHKSLWFSDALNFLNTGKSISDETYVKNKYGPTSNSLQIVLDILVKCNAISVRNVQFGNVRKDEYVSVIEPDLSVFSPEELGLIKRVSKEIREGHTAGSISQLSHTEIWKVADDFEELPHYALFASRKGKLTENDWARVDGEIAART